MLHGVIFGRLAPSRSQRRRIQAPVFLVGHPIDPIHPFVDADMLAAELPNVRFERATSILEWRFRPERLDHRRRRLRPRVLAGAPRDDEGHDEGPHPETLTPHPARTGLRGLGGGE